MCPHSTSSPSITLYMRAKRRESAAQWKPSCYTELESLLPYHKSWNSLCRKDVLVVPSERFRVRTVSVSPRKADVLAMIRIIRPTISKLFLEATAYHES
jgi:hypothetical protein